MTDDEQKRYEAEAQAYFEALDYAFDCIGPPIPKPTVEIPRARVVRSSWWRRLIGGAA